MSWGRFVDTRQEHVDIRYRRLPHWRADDAIYFVTFRLADSLPAAVVERIRAMPPRSTERYRLANRELDKAYGCCALRFEPAARVMFETLLKFDGARYDLFAACVMPNHVHAVIAPAPEWKLEQIMHSWKSFTAKEINRQRGATGRLWEPEYFDHIVRNADSFERFMRYVEINPVRAGLQDWPWVYLAPDLP